MVSGSPCTVFFPSSIVGNLSLLTRAGILPTYAGMVNLQSIQYQIFKTGPMIPALRMLFTATEISLWGQLRSPEIVGLGLAAIILVFSNFKFCSEMVGCKKFFF